MRSGGILNFARTARPSISGLKRCVSTAFGITTGLCRQTARLVAAYVRVVTMTFAARSRVDAPRLRR